MFPISPSLIIKAVIAATIFFAGWTANNWRRNSIEYVATNAANEAVKKSQAAIASAASDLEEKLSKGRETERIIERGIIKEIRTNETIYRNVCITDAGRVLLNESAKGRISSQPAKEMP